MSEYMNNEMNKEVSQEDLDAVLAILDKFGKSETGRLKVKVTDSMESGKVEKQYHMGRCDIGSAWAKGQTFDVLEDPKNPLMNEKNHGCQ